eukprot:2149160-Prymnesium_polylepis.1
MTQVRARRASLRRAHRAATKLCCDARMGRAPSRTAVRPCSQGLTAHYLTTSAHAQLVQPGEWMLIHGVAGGTCQWAAQMAKLKGYK